MSEPGPSSSRTEARQATVRAATRTRMLVAARAPTSAATPLATSPAAGAGAAAGATQPPQPSLWELQACPTKKVTAAAAVVSPRRRGRQQLKVVEEEKEEKLGEHESGVRVPASAAPAPRKRKLQTDDGCSGGSGDGNGSDVPIVSRRRQDRDRTRSEELREERAARLAADAAAAQGVFADVFGQAGADCVGPAGARSRPSKFAPGRSDGLFSTAATAAPRAASLSTPVGLGSAVAGGHNIRNTAAATTAAATAAAAAAAAVSSFPGGLKRRNVRRPPPATIRTADGACQRCGSHALVVTPHLGQLTCRACGNVATRRIIMPETNLVGFSDADGRSTQTHSGPGNAIIDGLFDLEYARAVAGSTKGRKVNEKTLQRRLHAQYQLLATTCAKANLKEVIMLAATELYAMALSGRRPGGAGAATPAAGSGGAGDGLRARMASLRAAMIRSPKEATAAVVWLTCRLNRAHCRSLKFICTRNGLSEVSDRRRAREIFKQLTAALGLRSKAFGVVDFIPRYGMLLRLPMAAVRFAESLYLRLARRHGGAADAGQGAASMAGAGAGPGVSGVPAVAGLGAGAGASDAGAAKGCARRFGCESGARDGSSGGGGGGGNGGGGGGGGGGSTTGAPAEHADWAPTTTAAGYVWFASQCCAPPANDSTDPLRLIPLSPPSVGRAHARRSNGADARALTAAAVEQETCVRTSLIVAVYRHVREEAPAAFSLNEWVALGEQGISLQNLARNDRRTGKRKQQ